LWKIRQILKELVYAALVEEEILTEREDDERVLRVVEYTP
jgi:hypothetical protein